jgi:hypothetical protein
MDIGPNVLVARRLYPCYCLVIWRWVYEWILGLSVFRERVYVLGGGERARTVVEILRAGAMRAWKLSSGEGEGASGGELERFAADLRAFCKPKPSH